MTFALIYYECVVISFMASFAALEAHNRTSHALRASDARLLLQMEWRGLCVCVFVGHVCELCKHG